MVELPFERIELPNGQWWEVYKLATRGMRKQLTAAIMGRVAKVSGNGFNALGNDEGALRGELLKHVDELDLSASDDTMLVCGTKAWSFGKKPVTIDQIDALPEKYTDPVLRRMQVLYETPTEEEVKN